MFVCLFVCFFPLPVFLSEEEVFLHVTQLFTNLVWCWNAHTAVASLSCDILPQVALLLAGHLAVQGALDDHFIRSHFFGEHSDRFVSITGFPDPFCLPICILARPLFLLFLLLLFLSCGKKRLNYMTRMRRGSNNRKTPKAVPSAKNN